MPLFTGHYGGSGQADGYSAASDGSSTGVGCGCAALIVSAILLMVAVFVVVGYFAVTDVIETTREPADFHVAQLDHPTRLADPAPPSRRLLNNR